MGKKPKDSTRKILLTGGHAATTALSVVEELIRQSSSKLKWDIYWIGAKKAMEGKSAPTLESEVFPKMDVKHHFIVAGRLQRKFTLWTIPSIAKIPLGFIHALLLLRKIKPDVILSFGGFAAFPVIVCGFFLKVPVVLHDQTSGVGRANRYSLPFAKKIAVSRKEALESLPKNKVLLTGNPIMTQIAEIIPKAKISTPPQIFVMGGSRGSVSINLLIGKILEDLLKKYALVHLAGSIDYERYKKKKSELSKALRQNYEVYEKIDPMQIDGVYKRADIIISRAGANTVSEIVAIKVPAILIPLPISATYDQPANAMMAKKFGIARVLPQQTLTPEKLLSEIYDIRKNWNKIVKKVKNKKSPDINAAKKLVDLVEDIVK